MKLLERRLVRLEKRRRPMDQSVQLDLSLLSDDELNELQQLAVAGHTVDENPRLAELMKKVTR